MNWISSLLVSLLSGLLGLFLGGLLGLGCVKWFRISSFEGASGYAVVGIAFCGGFLAFIIGLVAPRWGTGGTPLTFGSALLRASVSILVLALVVAGICRLIAGPQQATEGDSPASIIAPEIEEPILVLPPPDAPLADWIAVIQYGAPEETTARVVKAVAARPDFGSEAKPIIFGEDHRLAGATLNFIGMLPNPAPELNALVTEAGTDLAARFRRVNGLTEEEDPSFQAAADAALRFYGWIAAAKAMRTSAQGDFVPELLVLADLAKERQDSRVMREDVYRIAERTLKDWTGPANP